jgi:hypothetical protein
MTHDHQKRRCPRLGDLIHFSYCRTCGEHHEPCFKVLDCWWEYFDVVAYFERHLSREAFEKLRTARAPEKIASLMDLIEQARKRCRGTGA